ncbi:MAG: radical SAM protein, partial [Synechococcales cyanobacterium CRU_2_2]|nr:radical SAM protein [Synechococcales cyanobacterium CRU_2_2]
IPSSCPFNCIYCQLGDIETNSRQRQVFVPTEQVVEALEAADPCHPIDVVTLSGNGEPTLALNLEEILIATKQIWDKPTVVLTNSSLIDDPAVRKGLAVADQIAAKLDAATPKQLQSVNRPSEGIDFSDILRGLKQLRQEYQGYLAIQTMVLSAWSEDIETAYFQYLKDIQPNEVQINIPTRPRIIARRQKFLGTLALGLEPTGFRKLRCVDRNTLKTLAAKINAATQIPVHCVPTLN